ncbi:MAG: hypothetical protein GY786_22505 [Proteobacteria bacterium]|nr:hypothetical protein [Pseudomonadota bacterium]
MKAILKTVLLINLIVILSINNGISGTIGKGRAAIFNNNLGSAKSQATRNALRNAVEKGVGVILNSETVVKNWAILRDEVFSSSRGFVKNYSVIKDEQQGDHWVVEVDAEVAKESLENKLSELRILHKKMGNKRLMVLYNPIHPNALKKRHSAVLSSFTTIQMGFNDAGFRIFDQKSLDNIYQKFSQSGMNQSSVEQWIKIANQHQVDVLVEFEMLASRTRKSSKYKFNAAKSIVRMRVHNVSTGRLISNSQSQQQQFTSARVGSFDWENDLSKAGVKAGRAVTQETINNIVNFYKNVGDIGNSYFMVFKNFIEDDEDMILEILENLEGYQSLSELNNEPLLLEVEYFSNMEKSRLRRKLRAASKKQGIRIQSKQIAGNRFIFVNPEN